MRTPNVWPYFMPTSVGALMDPAFLRDAVNDAATRPWVEHVAPSPGGASWREKMASLKGWIAVHVHPPG